MGDDKIRFQPGMNGDPSQLESARAYNKKLQELGRELLAKLYMLVRNVRLHEASNVIFDRPLEQLKDLINTLLAMEGQLSLQCAGDSFYLNNMLLRTDHRSADSVKILRQELEAHDVGGFLLEQSVNTTDLRNFVFIFSRQNAEQVDERGVASHRLETLRLRRFEKLQEILARQGGEAEVTEQTEQGVDRKRYSLVVYARTVVFMQAYLAGLRGEGPEVPLSKVTHLVQDLVDICQGQRTHFLGVTSLDKGEEYLPFHSVNVAMLAIVFGSELGLPKERLRELGIAALLHDVGAVSLPVALLYKQGSLTPAEKRQLARTGILGAMQLLHHNRLDRRTIQCLLTAWGCQRDWGRMVKDHLGEAHHVACESDLGLFERIVALADGYDRLVFQQSLDPSLALVLMNTDLAHRFDPDLLRIFCHLLKGYTRKLLSETGERLELF